MKGRSILLDRLAGRRVAALVDGGVLDDLLVDPPADAQEGAFGTSSGTPPAPGAIARARPERPMKGMGGLFVRLPGGATGYLRGEKPLPQGTPVLVQVTGHAEPGKAIPLTRKVLFKARHAIVTPQAPGLNLSRSIRDEARRAALHALAEAAMAGSPMGLILRSGAAAADDAEIAADIAATRAQAEAVLADTAGDPAWLVAAPDAHALARRDWTGADEIDAAPGCLAARGLLEEIAALASPEVALPGGGFLAVEPTRALVAVDVNTGADASPAAALKANLAALRALPRALRLRGLGGQIVVDLAPLPKKDRRQAEAVAKAAAKACPVETAFIGWTPLGHMEFLRKRERLPLDAALLAAAG